MKVIGAGFGRTGTLSLKKALEIAGLGPCYHMEDMIKYPKHIDIWTAAAQGKPVNWDDIFSNYQSSLDFPASLFYRELLDKYPDAKVVLSVREPERWYQSMYDTAYTMMQLTTPAWFKKYVPQYKHFADLIDLLIWDGLFSGKFAKREHAIQVFNQHIEKVKQTVPADKLLIFSVKEGWQPLANFLDFPIPEGVLFPYVNDHETVKKQMQTARFVYYRALPALAITIVILISWLIVKAVLH